MTEEVTEKMAHAITDELFDEDTISVFCVLAKRRKDGMGYDFRYVCNDFLQAGTILNIAHEQVLGIVDKLTRGEA